MSGVNPVILMQLLSQYDNYVPSTELRTFTFTKNERMRVHRETMEEAKRRKSLLSKEQIQGARATVLKLLERSLKNKIGSVYIDPKMNNIAVPIQMTTGEIGYGILPTGSRVDIPDGEFIRAFTYWEKVNDIDLSCFGLCEDGERIEFSWRNMAYKQSQAITFSGDQTSGYNGGSEYFDIHLNEFKMNYPKVRYIIFCDNVYSNSNFQKCICTAGFMMRDSDPSKVLSWKGERGDPYEPWYSYSLRDRNAQSDSIRNQKSSKKVFDPKTVETSFQITSDSSFAYLFAIDLEKRQMIWLNVSRNGRHAIAGMETMSWISKMLKTTETMNIGKLFRMMASSETQNPEDASIVLTDDPQITDDKRVIRSWEYEKILNYLK